MLQIILKILAFLRITRKAASVVVTVADGVEELVEEAKPILAPETHLDIQADMKTTKEPVNE